MKCETDAEKSAVKSQDTFWFQKPRYVCRCTCKIFRFMWCAYQT